MYAVVILVLLELLNLLRNIKFGGYLIGWDNLFPEFNLALNWQRSLFSLWQEYRGLGTLDGMANGATLLHTFYITLLSLILPQNLLRFVFIHLTHLVGGLGFYYLLLHLTKHKKASFFGAIFYMFNLGIIQMYFAPLEVFAVHFAALPWLTLVILQAFKKPNKKNLIILFLTSLLTSPQGFVPTVFIAFLILFFFLLLFYVLQTRQYKTTLIIALCVFLGNAFWMVPYLYSALKTPAVIQNTRINEYGSEEIYYRNKAHGTLTDTLEFKGFMLTTIEYDQIKNTDVIFMNVWKNLSDTWWYQSIFALFLATGALGIYTIVKQRKREFYPFIATYLALFIFLANNTFLLEQINTLLRTLFPLLGEAFRFPFTKFITVFVFCFSILLTIGMTVLFEKFKKYSLLLIVLLCVGLGIMNYPVMTGNFTSPLLRLKVPQDYFNLIAYMKTQDPDQRIAMLPTHTFWNWHYRTWGQRGSGFLWYGLDQPTLERAFDPWSLQNEQEYNEMASAINSQDQALLNSVIQKYDLSYLLLDEYVINTISTQPVNIDSLTKFLDHDPLLTRDKTFGRLLLYKTKDHPRFVYQIPAPATVAASAFTRKDTAFIDNGIYAATTTSPEKIYPFSDLFTEKLQKDVHFQTKEDTSSVTLTQPDSHTLSADASIIIPSIYNADYLIPVKIAYKNRLLTLTPIYPQLKINNQPLAVPVEPISIQTPPDITSIVLNDISQQISLTSTSTAYLLKNFPNTLSLISKTSKINTIIDTSTLGKADIIIKIPNTKIVTLSATLQKISSSFSISNILTQPDLKVQKSDLDLQPFGGKSIGEAINLGDQYQLLAKSASVELDLYKANLPHQQSYLLLAQADYIKGLPIGWYMDNTQEKRAEVEGLFAKKSGLNTFVLPSSQDVFSGYGFHFTLKSVGTEDASSNLNKISLYPFPQQLLENIVITNQATTPKVTTRKTVTYQEPHPGLFIAQVSKNEPTLVLSQQYDPGWNAYLFTQKPTFLATYLPFIFGKRLANHSLINNWSNGWTMNSPQDGYVVISYMPSYLQYFGLFITFLATPLILLGMIVKKFRHRT